MKYDSTSKFLDLRRLVKGLYIYTFKSVFGYTWMKLKLTCQGIWVARACVISFAERGVIGSQCPGNFLLVCVFCWNEFSHKKNQPYSRCLPLQSPFAPPASPSLPWYHLLSLLKRAWRWRSRPIWKLGWGLL